MGKPPGSPKPPPLIRAQGADRRFAPDYTRAVIQARKLSKRFGDKRVLEALDLEVPRGGFVLVTGPNGSGKTTLLRLCAGLFAPTGGELEVDVPRGAIGFLAHEPLVYRELTALENLDLYGRLYRLPERRERAGAMLERFGLWRVRNERAGTFSRGMLQRLALCRTFDRGDVDPLHGQHRLHGALRLGGIGIGHQREQAFRHDLPRQAELVLHPAALLGFWNRGERCGQPVDLVLILAIDLKRERLVEGEVRPTVQTDELPSSERELDRQHVALLAARIIGWRAVDGIHMRVGQQ